MKKRLERYATPVFWISIPLVGIVVLLGSLFSTEFQSVTEQIRNVISNDRGWHYLLLVAGIVIFCLFVIFSPIGQIRLGRPGFQTGVLQSLVDCHAVSAGMGIGLVFWGAAEPLSRYAVSAPTGQVLSQKALSGAFRYTFFHWGIHAWAVYAAVALALAYFKFKKKKSI